MPRHTRMTPEQKQAENLRQAQENRLPRLRAELHAEWRSGRTMPADIISVIRAAEQQRLKQKQRRVRRREEARRHRQESQQAAER